MLGLLLRRALHRTAVSLESEGAKKARIFRRVLSQDDPNFFLNEQKIEERTKKLRILYEEYNKKRKDPATIAVQQTHALEWIAQCPTLTKANPSSTLNYLSSIPSHHPAYHAAIFRLVNILLAWGFPKIAKKYLEKAMRDDPNSETYKTILKSVNQAIDAAPKISLVQQVKNGEQFLKLDLPVLAYYCFEDVIECQMRETPFKRMYHCFEEILVEDPNYHDVIMGKARACEKLKLYRKAIVLYQIVIDYIEGTNIPPHKLGREIFIVWSNAKKELEAALQLRAIDKNSPPSNKSRRCLEKAQALIEVGEYYPRDYLLKVSFDSPQIVPALVGLGKLACLTKEYSEAQGYFGMALEIDPQSEAAYRGLELALSFNNPKASSSNRDSPRLPESYQRNKPA